MSTKTFNRRNSDWQAHGQTYGQKVSRYARAAARLNSKTPSPVQALRPIKGRTAK